MENEETFKIGEIVELIGIGIKGQRYFGKIKNIENFNGKITFWICGFKNGKEGEKAYKGFNFKKIIDF